MKSILISLSAVATYAKLCEMGFPNKAILAAVIMGMMINYTYDIIIKSDRPKKLRNGQSTTHILYYKNIELSRGGSE